MNAMLGRLDDAADRQRRFVSDASARAAEPADLVAGAARGQPGVQARSPTGRPAKRGARRGHRDAAAGRRPARPGPARRPVGRAELRAGRPRRHRAARGRAASDARTGDRRHASRCRRGRCSAIPISCGERAQRARQRRTPRGARGRGLGAGARRARSRCASPTTAAASPVEDRERIFERFGRIDDARTRGRRGHRPRPGDHARDRRGARRPDHGRGRRPGRVLRAPLPGR